ncbi:MAG: hypothetical protein DMG14_02580 [Acidobacteria bacterium]|nr:MAG: hypothetical protein DMG14_02580 [Acidobacteriota bacterium]
MDIRRFDSLAEADEADHQYYASLTPEERLDILLELIDAYRSSYGEAAERFERVYRIDELSQC